MQELEGKGDTGMRILKQILDIADESTYNLPGMNVTPLSVQEQGGTLVLYFMTDATDFEIVYRSQTVSVRILIAGTGHERSDLADARYLGTVMMSYGLVWHCFAEE